MENAIIVIVCLIVLAFISCWVGGVIVNVWYKYKVLPYHNANTEPNVEVMKILLEDKSVEKINTVLDDMIREVAGVYQIFALSTMENNQYINSEEQEKMERYIETVVTRNIHGELENLLKLIYRINSKEDLEQLVSTRTKIFMINFVINYNKDIE